MGHSCVPGAWILQLQQSSERVTPPVINNMYIRDRTKTNFIIYNPPGQANHQNLSPVINNMYIRDRTKTNFIIYNPPGHEHYQNLSSSCLSKSMVENKIKPLQGFQNIYASSTHNQLSGQYEERNFHALSTLLALFISFHQKALKLHTRLTRQ